MVLARTLLSLQALATVTVIACAPANPNTSTAVRTAGVSLEREPECYSLSYRDSGADKSSRLFPTWIEIFPASGSGAAIGRHHAAMSDVGWNALLKYSGWKKIAGDSLEIMFTGSYEGISIHVARLNSGLSGRATWLTDLIGPPTISLPLVGARESCPEARAPVTEDGFWKTATPAEDPELNATALTALESLCERTKADACLVVHRGRIVQEWYSKLYSTPMYAMSSTKSVAGLLTGMLIDDGRIKGIEEPVCDFLPTWCSGLRAKVTVRHLLSMTSGLPMMPDSGVGSVGDKNAYVTHLTPTAEPGTKWAYSNEGAQLMSPILDRAAGEPIQDYARRRLFEPLGMNSTRLHVYPDHAWTYADMETTARDFARLGVLMLNQGTWNGRQVVSPSWLIASTRPSQSLNARYGLLWWIDPEIQGYAAHGYLDTSLHVIPDLDLVVVRMQSKPAADAPTGQYEREALSLFRALVTKRN